MANHDMLLLVAGREQQEVERCGRLSGQAAKSKALVWVLLNRPAET